MMRIFFMFLLLVILGGCASATVKGNVYKIDTIVPIVVPKEYEYLGRYSTSRPSGMFVSDVFAVVDDGVVTKLLCFEQARASSNLVYECINPPFLIFQHDKYAFRYGGFANDIGNWRVSHYLDFIGERSCSLRPCGMYSLVFGKILNRIHIFTVLYAERKFGFSDDQEQAKALLMRNMLAVLGRDGEPFILDQ